MASNSGDMRSVFPGWPSELEVAQGAGNWGMMAQSFFFSASVLSCEYEKGQIAFPDCVGVCVDIDAWQRVSTIPAQFFCMAFALELAIKAARVGQGDLSTMQPGDTLPFGAHNLRGLAQSVRSIELTPEELDFLNTAGELISNGKYPVPKKPSGKASRAVHDGNYRDFEKLAAPLFERFIRLAIESSVKE